MIPSRRIHPAWIVLGAVTHCMMAGSGLRSVFGVYEGTGAYSIAFVSAALMGLLAAGLALAIREEPIARRPAGSPAPATT